MSELRDLQRWFLSAVTAGVPEGVAPLAGTATFPPEVGLAVYGNAYLVRLVECLRESFPMVSRLVGVEAFESLAVDYLRASPPRGPGLGTLGAGFSAHLERTRPPESGSATACVVALARYERALDEVFDGPGSEGSVGIAPDALSDLSPEAWRSTRLVANPALRLYRFAFPVDDVWSALRGISDGEALASLPAPGVQCVALSRRDFVVRRSVLEPEEHELLSCLVSGAVIGDALSSLPSGVDASALEGWFARWMREGFFVALERC